MLKSGGSEKWPVLAAAVEAAATGVILFIRPSLFARLVFDAEFSAAGQALARLAAIALLGLALASWPTADMRDHMGSSVRAMLIYNLLAAIYLLYLGIEGGLTGVLLRPAIALHAILSVLLGRAWIAKREVQGGEDFLIQRLKLRLRTRFID